MARFTFVVSCMVGLTTGLTGFGDVLQVGNRFPEIAFWGADGQIENYGAHLGKRSIVFVFASW